MFRRTPLILILVIVILLSFGCRQEDRSRSRDPSRLQVVTTLFPLYDFSRAIAGDRADVKLLLPPGMEPHNFEPKPDDVLNINRAGLFVYTNRYMEPWADGLIKGIDRTRLKVVDASEGITFIDAKEEQKHSHKRHSESERGVGKDPHVWLDLANAGKMVDTILSGFLQKDPANSAYYTANATSYKKRLADLDQRYQTVLAGCETKTMLHAGHAAFGYTAKRYGLKYFAATGVDADAEPTPAKLAELVKKVRELKLAYIFSEELVSPRLAETIASETGARILRLHAGHNIGKDEMISGLTFASLMEENLNILSKGLQCRR